MTHWIEYDKINGELSQCLHFAGIKTLPTFVVIEAEADQVACAEEEEEYKSDEYGEGVEDPAGYVAVLWGIERARGVALKLKQRHQVKNIKR